MKWAVIPNMENYEVSEHGQVRRLPHSVPNGRGGIRNLPMKMLKLAKNHDGYMRVKVGHKLIFAHVLVLESFVGERPDGMQCCHNNGIPDDNRLINLRWDTPKNNVHDRRFHGTYQYGERNPNFKHGNSFYCQKRKNAGASQQRQTDTY